jgi:L,D-transpeptidase ErfK/SrfK
MLLRGLVFALVIGAASIAKAQVAVGMIGAEQKVPVARAIEPAIFAREQRMSPRAFNRDNPALARLSKLRVGDVAKIDSRHLVPLTLSDGILINIPQRTLFFFRAGKVESFYFVGLGRKDWQSPVGLWKIVGLETDPTWYVPESIQEEMRQQGDPVLKVVKPGPDNPLGKYAIRLSSLCAIHGTNAIWTVYAFKSHGCARLLPGAIEELFSHVQVGMAVRSVYEPALLWSDSRTIWLEVHPDVYRRSPHLLARLRTAAMQQGIAEQIDWTKVQRELRRPSERPIDVGSLPTSGTAP